MAGIFAVVLGPELAVVVQPKSTAQGELTEIASRKVFAASLVLLSTQKLENLLSDYDETYVMVGMTIALLVITGAALGGVIFLAALGF